MQADVIVSGAGAVGGAIACSATRAGMRVLDQGDVA
jgi:glycine/D-amino acid oxidase-like deaminating enzyme